MAREMVSFGNARNFVSCDSKTSGGGRLAPAGDGRWLGADASCALMLAPSMPDRKSTQISVCSLRSAWAPTP
jgi:hypothetical protein